MRRFDPPAFLVAGNPDTDGLPEVRREVSKSFSWGLVLKRAESLSSASVHEVKVVIFLNEDRCLLWQLQYLQKREPRR